MTADAKTIASIFEAAGQRAKERNAPASVLMPPPTLKRPVRASSTSMIQSTLSGSSADGSRSWKIAGKPSGSSK